MIICGIKLTHDASIALIDNGKLVFCYELEKINNNSRHSSIAATTIEECVKMIKINGYTLDKIDSIVFDGWHKEDHDVLNGTLANLKLAGYGSVINGDSVLHESSFRLESFHGKGRSYKHTASHVTSSYCSSPFSKAKEDAYIFVWDGGMFPQLFYYSYAKNEFQNIGNLFSLTSLIYQSVAICFEPFSIVESEYYLSLPGKIMAFAAMGIARSNLVALFREPELKYNMHFEEIDIASIEKMNTDYVSALNFNEIRKFAPPDIIASLQEFIQELILKSLREACEGLPNNKRNICLAGGAALNIVWNSSIRESKIFEDVWIPPFPNDSGSGIGAACCEMMKYSEYKSLNWNVYSGPMIEAGEIPSSWEKWPCSTKQLAKLLNDFNEPIVFLNEHAELGPRALGNRSIIAPANNSCMKHFLNSVKSREFYRPVAPICLEEYAKDVFDPGVTDPYMLFTHYVKDAWKNKVPAICHTDGTARVQTVNEKQNPVVYSLLQEYMNFSAIPLLCNTSANFNGKGFFPSVQSAIEWGKLNMVWNNGFVYVRKGHDKYLYNLV